jgi:hypothetical protein
MIDYVEQTVTQVTWTLLNMGQLQARNTKASSIGVHCVKSVTLSLLVRIFWTHLHSVLSLSLTKHLLSSIWTAADIIQNGEHSFQKPALNSLHCNVSFAVNRIIILSMMEYSNSLILIKTITNSMLKNSFTGDILCQGTKNSSQI